MINYSISLRANPSDQDAPKKAYANAQYSEIMTLDKFAEHISTHGSKYNRADIQAVLIRFCALTSIPATKSPRSADQW